jgi:hypothetical protein
MQSALFEFTKAHTTLKAKLGINMSGLQYAQQKFLAGSAYANTFLIESMKAAKTYFLPGEAGKKSAEAYLDKIKTLFEEAQINTSKDAEDDAMSRAREGVLEASAPPGTISVVEEWKKPPPKAVSPSPPPTDAETIQLFVGNAMKFDTEDQAIDYLEESMESPQGLSFKQFEEALAIIMKHPKFEEERRTTKPFDALGARIKSRF